MARESGSSRLPDTNMNGAAFFLPFPFPSRIVSPVGGSGGSHFDTAGMGLIVKLAGVESDLSSAIT